MRAILPVRRRPSIWLRTICPDGYGYEHSGLSRSEAESSNSTALTPALSGLRLPHSECTVRELHPAVVSTVVESYGDVVDRRLPPAQQACAAGLVAEVVTDGEAGATPSPWHSASRRISATAVALAKDAALRARSRRLCLKASSMRRNFHVSVHSADSHEGPSGPSAQAHTRVHPEGRKL